ncbi:MAG: hypothetical protein MPK10_02165 [Gammaproteobacteria bacterium]|nr:hypothetical protein [Gammaproteobacteria bacterium]MDA7971372.1 hypothetical protein [Gammaproteobacteria bacterium]
MSGPEFARRYRGVAPLPREMRRSALPTGTAMLREAVGILPAHLRRAMRTKCRILLLSGYTIGKLRHDRPEISPGHFVLVQRILDGRHIYADGARHFTGFARDDDGNWWTAVWKKTRDGREVFLETFHRGGIKGRLRDAESLSKKKGAPAGSASSPAGPSPIRPK